MYNRANADELRWDEATGEGCSTCRLATIYMPFWLRATDKGRHGEILSVTAIRVPSSADAPIGRGCQTIASWWLIKHPSAGPSHLACNKAHSEKFILSDALLVSRARHATNH